MVSYPKTVTALWFVRLFYYLDDKCCCLPIMYYILLSAKSVRALFQTLRRHRDLVRNSQKSASFTQNKRLLLYREIIAVFGQNDAKRKYKLRKQSKAFSIKRCWMSTDHNALKSYFFTDYIIRPFSEHAVSIRTFCLSLVTSTSRPPRSCWSVT